MTALICGSVAYDTIMSFDGRFSDALLADLAKQAAHAGALAEVNEKWSCPSPRTVAALARAGVRLVAGSDSHHCRDIGVYERWVRPTASAVGA